MAKRQTRVQTDAQGGDPSDLLSKVVGSLRAGMGDKESRGVIIRSADGDELKPFDAVPFGIESLDKFLHGGIPVGRITELFGVEGSGKTTLCYHAMAAHCRAMDAGQAGLALYIDSEYRFDAPYAAAIGVDTSRVIVAQPEWGQQAMQLAFNFAEDVALLRDGLDPTKPIMKNKTIVGHEPLSGGEFTGHAAIFVDSVAALVPKSQYDRIHTDGDFEGVAVAEQARMMSQHLANLVGPISRAKVACLMTNQIRSTINPYGSPTTTPGGNALKFYASSRWETGRRGFIKEGSSDDARIVGSMGSLRVVKCSLFAPFAPELRLPYTERGIDMARLVFDALIVTEALKKEGSWYRFKTPVGHPYAALSFQGTNGFYTMLDEGTLSLAELTILAQGKWVAPA